MIADRILWPVNLARAVSSGATRAIPDQLLAISETRGKVNGRSPTGFNPPPDIMLDEIMRVTERRV
ncbi:hypothetical protein A3D00_04110 [Candidatus Woesebacteria bacterium RIFCSPHIGHO2_02_FULL_38_9]|nr:MAG: hypothetical protein A3D00_04110 [Candidatus Woesebacteria bacterium RIFCSPHIGHO2_02_FULL_38_9]OGM57904.1 MAG: hypothetical protein A3A50_04695 [Candidatus Woesebacteria bacterium RIFCSPLOWO2_01_FULL_38_20]